MTPVFPPFPDRKEAPPEIVDPDDGCGLLSMWLVLHVLGRQVEPATILKLARYIPGEGVTTIGLALGFHDLGLKTEFRCEGVCAVDKALMQEAEAKKMAILPPADLNTLLALPAVLIVAYDTSSGVAHVSPVTKLSESNILLAVEDIPVQAIRTLEERRRHSLMESISVYPS